MCLVCSGLRTPLKLKTVFEFKTFFVNWNCAFGIKSLIYSAGDESLHLKLRVIELLYTAD